MHRQAVAVLTASLAAIAGCAEETAPAPPPARCALSVATALPVAGAPPTRRAAAVGRPLRARAMNGGVATVTPHVDIVQSPRAQAFALDLRGVSGLLPASLVPRLAIIRIH